MQMIKKIVLFPIEWVIYSVLSESQRKKIGDMFSDEQKDAIRRWMKGKKYFQRKKLKDIKYHLYNLGFTDKALQELHRFYDDIDSKDIKRLIAWELVLWYAGDYSEHGAEKALQYVPAARDGETDLNQLRRIAIVEAECLDILNRQAEAMERIQELLAKDRHPDLYFAAANLEKEMNKRLEWINKAMALFNLAPIHFGDKTNPVYDDIKTDMSRLSKATDGPKVSVILPAFKAEDGIRIAIESILSQTWQNLELIVVDDCSPDRTAEVVKEYVKEDPRVQLLSTPVNSGPYVARNIGLKAAAGDFVTVNDADDWSHPQKIETQVKHLMNHPNIIANTSEHARLTEDLKFYRRGTPGKYIFPNMSSIMFRREPVMEKLGFWDSVRFAADGEFKRRLLRAFGKASFANLPTGPLSLPRQSVSSLTSSSAFGYNGFFMGVRKEYVEAMENYYLSAANLYYPYPMEKRPFPVPEPMWPKREEKRDGLRHFDYVIAADFREENPIVVQQLRKYMRTGRRTGLVQINKYDFTREKKISKEVRTLIDGNVVQLLVYGEKIHADTLLIIDPFLLEDYQQYVPMVTAENVEAVLLEQPAENARMDQIIKNIQHFFGQIGTWYPWNEEVRESFLNRYGEYENHIPFSRKTWREQVGNEARGE